MVNIIFPIETIVAWYYCWILKLFVKNSLLLLILKLIVHNSFLLLILKLVVVNSRLLFILKLTVDNSLILLFYVFTGPVLAWIRGRVIPTSWSAHARLAISISGLAAWKCLSLSEDLTRNMAVVDTSKKHGKLLNASHVKNILNVEHKLRLIAMGWRFRQLSTTRYWSLPTLPWREPCPLAS